jgi:hypothetical protein
MGAGVIFLPDIARVRLALLFGGLFVCDKLQLHLKELSSTARVVEPSALKTPHAETAWR